MSTNDKKLSTKNSDRILRAINNRKIRPCSKKNLHWFNSIFKDQSLLRGTIHEMEEFFDVFEVSMENFHTFIVFFDNGSVLQLGGSKFRDILEAVCEIATKYKHKQSDLVLRRRKDQKDLKSILCRKTYVLPSLNFE